MALPKKKKKIIPDIVVAVQKAAASQEQTKTKEKPAKKKTVTAGVNRGGRPSPRSGNVARMTLLLSEDTAERLTMALATEQVKRRKAGEKVDKSLLIEEAILAWLDDKGL